MRFLGRWREGLGFIYSEGRVRREGRGMGREGRLRGKYFGVPVIYWRFRSNESE